MSNLENKDLVELITIIKENYFNEQYNMVGFLAQREIIEDIDDAEVLSFEDIEKMSFDEIETMNIKDVKEFIQYHKILK